MTIDLAFNIALSLVAALAGLLIKNLYNRLDSSDKSRNQFEQQTTKDLTDIKVQYLLKTDLNRTQDQIMISLHDLSNKMDKINDKLDRKVDK